MAENGCVRFKHVALVSLWVKVAQFNGEHWYNYQLPVSIVTPLLTAYRQIPVIIENEWPADKKKVHP